MGIRKIKDSVRSSRTISNKIRLITASDFKLIPPRLQKYTF